MEKQYFVNKEYNKLKRKNAVVLSVILTMMLLSMSAVFASGGNYVIAVIFALLVIVPIIAIPSGFKNYPISEKPQIIITDSNITINDKIFTIKEVLKISVLIEVPSSKIDKKDVEFLEYLRTTFPEDNYVGTFDIIYLDEKGKKQVAYSTIDHVVDALINSAKVGVKNYELKFTMKKNSVVNICDLKAYKEEKVDKSLEEISKKTRKRQLL